MCVGVAVVDGARRVAVRPAVLLALAHRPHRGEHLARAARPAAGAGRTSGTRARYGLTDASIEFCSSAMGDSASRRWPCSACRSRGTRGTARRRGRVAPGPARTSARCRPLRDVVERRRASAPARRGARRRARSRAPGCSTWRIGRSSTSAMIWHHSVRLRAAADEVQPRERTSRRTSRPSPSSQRRVERDALEHRPHELGAGRAQREVVPAAAQEVVVDRRALAVQPRREDHAAAARRAPRPRARRARRTRRRDRRLPQRVVGVEHVVAQPVRGTRRPSPARRRRSTCPAAATAATRCRAGGRSS